MRIKVLDMGEADMRKAEARFKDEVSVHENEDCLYDLTFKDGCTISTHVEPVNQMIIYNSDADACICLFDTDFSEVHII